MKVGKAVVVAVTLALSLSAFADGILGSGGRSGQLGSGADATSESDGTMGSDGGRSGLMGSGGRVASTDDGGLVGSGGGRTTSPTFGSGARIASEDGGTIGSGVGRGGPVVGGNATNDDGALGSGGGRGGNVTSNDGGAMGSGVGRGGPLVGGNVASSDGGQTVGSGGYLGSGNDTTEGDSPVVGSGVGDSSGYGVGSNDDRQIFGSGTRVESQDGQIVGPGARSGGYIIGGNAFIVSDELGAEYLVVTHGDTFAIYALD